MAHYAVSSTTIPRPPIPMALAKVSMRTSAQVLLDGIFVIGIWISIRQPSLTRASIRPHKVEPDLRPADLMHLAFVLHQTHSGERGAGIIRTREIHILSAIQPSPVSAFGSQW